MKNEKQIQEAVWEQMCNEYYPIRSWASPFQKKIREAVAKTIELMKPIGIIRHEPIDVDAYKCGYEAGCTEFANTIKKRAKSLFMYDREVQNVKALEAKIDTLLKEMTKNETTKKA